jgi:hypothetical protein
MFGVLHEEPKLLLKVLKELNLFTNPNEAVALVKENSSLNRS